MTQSRMSLEMRVGAFIMTGVALLIAFLFAIGDFSTYFQPNYQAIIVFDSANSIGPGSPVQYAGIEVGKVEGVRIVTGPDSSPDVEVLVRLPKAYQVRTQDQAAISTFGLLGEKFVEIIPGPQTAPPLAPGQTLRGKPPVSTDQIIERSNAVLTQLQQALAGVNDFVGDPEARENFREALIELRDATRSWKELNVRLHDAVTHIESGEGSLGKLLYDDQLYSNINGFVNDIRAHPWKLLSKPKSEK